VREGGGTQDRTIDAVGPEAFTYRELVRRIGDIIGRPRPVVSVPPAVGHLVGVVMGKLLGDVVVTRAEIAGLTGNLLRTDSPPAGRTRLADWARAHADALGVRYAGELARRTDRMTAYEKLRGTARARDRRVPCGLAHGEGLAAQARRAADGGHSDAAPVAPPGWPGAATTALSPPPTEELRRPRAGLPVRFVLGDRASRAAVGGEPRGGGRGSAPAAPAGGPETIGKGVSAPWGSAGRNSVPARSACTVRPSLHIDAAGAKSAWPRSVTI